MDEDEYPLTQAAQCEYQKNHRKGHGPPTTTGAQVVYLNHNLYPKTPIHIPWWWPHFTLVLTWTCVKGVGNRIENEKNGSSTYIWNIIFIAISFFNGFKYLHSIVKYAFVMKCDKREKTSSLIACNNKHTTRWYQINIIMTFNESSTMTQLIFCGKAGWIGLVTN